MLENEELRCLRRWLRVCPSGQEEPSSPNKKSRTASQPDQIIEKVDHDLEKIEIGKMKKQFRDAPSKKSENGKSLENLKIENTRLLR